jgi:hypothetical protein
MRAQERINSTRKVDGNMRIWGKKPIKSIISNSRNQ